MTRRKDWWNVKWSGQKKNTKKKYQVNSQSESDMSESEFSEKNPQKCLRACACQLTKTTTCSVLRVITLPTTNDDLLSVMKWGNGGRQSEKDGFGSRTESAKFHSDPQPETKSSMGESEAGSATPVPAEADMSSDWDATTTFAAARIESPPLGGQQPMLTSATRGSASAQDLSGSPDQSFWDCGSWII